MIGWAACLVAIQCEWNGGRRYRVCREVVQPLTPKGRRQTATSRRQPPGVPGRPRGLGVKSYEFPGSSHPIRMDSQARFWFGLQSVTKSTKSDCMGGRSTLGALAVWAVGGRSLVLNDIGTRALELTFSMHFDDAVKWVLGWPLIARQLTMLIVSHYSITKHLFAPCCSLCSS